MRIGVLPASGLASRIGGIPKFMLPYDSGPISLLEHHVSMMIGNTDQIVIPTRSEWSGWVKDSFSSYGVDVRIVETKSLTETVLKVIEGEECEELLLGLPDTAIPGDNPYKLSLQNELRPLLDVGAFETASEDKGTLGSLQLGPTGLVLGYADKDPSLEWGYHWGSLLIGKQAMALIAPQWLTIGDLIGRLLREGCPVTYKLVRSPYFDCGTVEGYFRFVRSGGRLR